MSSTLTPVHHVCAGFMEARLRYLVDDPPERIELRGVRWVIDNQEMKERIEEGRPDGRLKS